MKKACFLITIVLALTFSCHKNDNKSSVQNAFTQNSYPMAVGDWWQYQVIDYGGGGSDTLILKVISLSVNGTKKDFTCHLLRKNTIVDSGHYVQSDSVISYRGSTGYSLFGQFILRFPFVNGQKWSGTFPTDTFVVTGIADSFAVSSYGPWYKPVYSLHRVFSDPHYSMIQNIILTPNIGLVLQDIDLHSDTAADVWESINLLSYYVQ